MVLKSLTTKKLFNTKIKPLKNLAVEFFNPSIIKQIEKRMKYVSIVTLVKKYDQILYAFNSIVSDIRYCNIRIVIV
jgi:hypothetical protein